MTTEDFVLHDECPRRRTWGSQFQFPRIPLPQALNDALRAGLLSGDPQRAKEHFMAAGASPGLDIDGHSVYDVAVHHANLLETVCAYLIGGDGPWKPVGAVSCDSFEFQPLSYLLPDGRLRRAVLCSSWGALREQEERNSWRTVADVYATGRPMLINAIVIGQSKSGFRPSPWTQGFLHPENRVMRVRKKEGRFTPNWKRIYREQTDKKTADWLKLMQEDEAFDDLVYSTTVDIQEGHRRAVLSDMSRIAKQIEGAATEPRRSACFRYAPCPFAKVCYYPQSITPREAGWEAKK